MSFPLRSTGAVIGAAVLTQKAARVATQAASRRISQAIGFDEILQSSNDPSASPRSLEELVADLTEAIKETLSKTGTDANLPPQVIVQPDGEIRIESTHARAAEFEARLTEDSNVRRLVQQILDNPARKSDQSLAIDLTNGHAEVNIPGPPGGYANWLAD